MSTGKGKALLSDVKEAPEIIIAATDVSLGDVRATECLVSALTNMLSHNSKTFLGNLTKRDSLSAIAKKVKSKYEKDTKMASVVKSFLSALKKAKVSLD